MSSRLKGEERRGIFVTWIRRARTGNVCSFTHVNLSYDSMNAANIVRNTSLTCLIQHA
jgi:hypothetical protein